MLNLHHLKILQAVAAAESYSRAAERLGISQPAVSMQVARLEEAVGVALVASRGRQVLLTEAGRVLARHAERIFQMHDEALQAMADFRGLRRGRLRLGASSTPGAYLLPALIAAYKNENPGVEVSLCITNTQGAVRLVTEGLVDLAVVGEAPAEPADADLTPIAADTLAVVVAPGHRWEDRTTVSSAELAAEPLILREQGSSTREALDRRLAFAGLKARVAMELGSTEAVKEAVAAGLGAAVLSGLAVRAEVAAGRMRALSVSDLDLTRDLHLALPRSAEPPLPVARFLALLQKR